MDKYRISVLADDLYTKRQRVRMLEMSNILSDPEEARKAFIELEQARAEELQAALALEREKMRG